MKVLATLLSFGAISVALFAFRPVVQEVDQAQATRKARSFAVARGSGLQSTGARTMRRQGVGSILIYEVVFQTKYGVKVDVEAATGQVVGFRDNEAMERRRLAGPIRNYKLPDRNMAARHVDQVAKKLGLPPSWKRVSLDFYLDNTPGRGDSDRTGAVTATYQAAPKGHPHLIYSPSMRLRVDPSNGRLVEYTFFDHTLVGGAKVEISGDRATKIAEAAHARNRIVARHAHRAVSSASLGWAVPNGMFGSRLPADTAAPFLARLVYNVPFERSFVWIDARSGEVVGGDVYK